MYVCMYIHMWLTYIHVWLLVIKTQVPFSFPQFPNKIIIEIEVEY